ncbi:hypothetical protein ACFO9Q_00525 [Paenibacillus sp. GCM10023252]|uniref:hypothetical protein n=1 Tax=Paenibacillus sp. GCM10023252 TaxID=3252649 RepID=UPI003619061D
MILGFIFIILYGIIMLLVVEIAVVLLNITGLDRDISRFQAISMLTGTGFTTLESELILRHPTRRKIGIFLILFGAFSLAVIISTISNILAESFRITQVSVLIAILSLLLLLVKRPQVQRSISSRFHKHMTKDMELHELPVQETLYLDDEDLFCSVTLHWESAYNGKEAGRLLGADEDINLLFIRRGEIHVRKNRFSEALVAGDVLYLYGRKEEIKRKFKAEMEEAQVAADDAGISSLT